MDFCYNSDKHSVEERIKAFYSLWFDKKDYIFSSGTEFKPRFHDNNKSWLKSKRFLSSLYAFLCMEGIPIEYIVGIDATKWCLDNPNEILVVYCGEAFNLEMKFCQEKGLLYRLYKEPYV